MRSFLAIAGAVAVLHGVTAASEPVGRLVEFDSPITPASAERITSAVADADREGNDFVLIELDTPGGEKETLEELVKDLLASRVPIVVWVGPSGARAASAGFFVLLAADVAAMAPGTRTGAASVIYGIGKSEEGDILLRKVNNDAAALARSIAERRGRDPKAAEAAVIEARSYTETDALSARLIDLVVNDRTELLNALDGRTVKRFDGASATLRTEGARFVESQFDWTQDVKEFLATPVVAFFLFLLGLGGLYVELTHPGLVFPGVVGALALVLFAFSARMLPVSAVGVLLVLLGIVMFILEIKIVSYGMLGFGGTLCLVLGSVMLFPSSIPELRLPLVVVLPASLTLAALCAIAVRLAVRAQRTPVQTGIEGLRGERGTAAEPLEPEGRVFVHGELWDAVSTSGRVERGARIRVVAVSDLRLSVEPDPVGSSRER